MIHFTIRDLLWLMVVSALAIVLWIERTETANLRHDQDAVRVALKRCDIYLGPSEAGGYVLMQQCAEPTIDFKAFRRWVEAGCPSVE